MLLRWRIYCYIVIKVHIRISRSYLWWTYWRYLTMRMSAWTKIRFNFTTCPRQPSPWPQGRAAIVRVNPFRMFPKTAARISVALFELIKRCPTILGVTLLVKCAPVKVSPNRAVTGLREISQCPTSWVDMIMECLSAMQRSWWVALRIFKDLCRVKRGPVASSISLHVPNMQDASLCLFPWMMRLC